MRRSLPCGVVIQTRPALAIGVTGTYAYAVKRPTATRLAHLILRLAVTIAVFVALYVNANGVVVFALLIGILVWSVADIALWVYRQSRTS
jgi:hypothetical protein